MFSKDYLAMSAKERCEHGFDYEHYLDPGGDRRICHPPNCDACISQIEPPPPPHCDPSVLHAPGECRYCDQRPDWQKYRQLAHIAFTGQAASDGLSPCPSTWFRAPSARDHWFGNSPIISEDPV